MDATRSRTKSHQTVSADPDRVVDASINDFAQAVSISVAGRLTVDKKQQSIFCSFDIVFELATRVANFDARSATQSLLSNARACGAIVLRERLLIGKLGFAPSNSVYSSSGEFRNKGPYSDR